MLFVSAKVGHLNLLPQGEPEKYLRATAMIDGRKYIRNGKPTKWNGKKKWAKNISASLQIA
jgi:hypothetical protein